MLCSLALAASPARAFMHLDSLIAKQEANIARKEKSIARIRAKLDQATTPSSQYAINTDLYRAYVDFQNDSAQQVTRRNIEIAKRMSDNVKLNESTLQLMYILTKAYLLDEVEHLAHNLDTTKLNAEQKLEYDKVMSDFYLFKLEFNNGSVYENTYQQQLTLLRKRIAARAEQGSERQVLYKAYFLHDTGQTTKATALLEQLLAKHRSGQHIYSVVASSLAFFYGQQGKRDKQKELLAMSAASDMEGCIMENSALRQLAELLFDEGDIDRAYRYINRSVADATYYGTRLRNVQASQLVPRIISAYQDKQDKNYRSMRMLIIALSVLAALLVAGMLLTGVLYRRYRRLSESRKLINDQLGITVDKLESANEQLRERDKIKEQYLGRFLTFSSKLIDKNAVQRKALNRLAMEDKLKELKAQLKNPQPDYESARQFYQNFDSAFLNIYPNFIESVNDLLQEGEHIEPKEGEQLTRELRILALIRLGITDNKEIASILRASIATVYTYRSRLKARAINKDTLENDIKRIQAINSNSQ